MGQVYNGEMNGEQLLNLAVQKSHKSKMRNYCKICVD